jgi:hypothetical protein
MDAKMTNDKYFGVLIKTDPAGNYSAKAGWDECFTDRKKADECCRRAGSQFVAAKVVEMSNDEAIANGWIAA